MIDVFKIVGGIPPDPDQKVLLQCSYKDCEKTHLDEPLACAAAGGKLATFCREHYDLLCGIHQVEVKIEWIKSIGMQPTRGTPQRAYYDVYSAENVDLIPGRVTMVRTGIKVQAPKGYFIDIRPRSGLASQGVTINNSPGTVDCDYGGELIVELIYHAPLHIPHFDKHVDRIYASGELRHGEMQHAWGTYKINVGDRIAQMCVMKMYEISFVTAKVEGTAGFGSTGK
jgi:deoxyuridine 5'-triphosphate nucleotidohydrolase